MTAAPLTAGRNEHNEKMDVEEIAAFRSDLIEVIAPKMDISIYPAHGGHCLALRLLRRAD
ncbi:hypothetical protein [Breoghania sp. L-A4]|uniref:hypothetical protein n=1 Tax=Breoghania sp. L-A4 TaxID=2304600 RepID=UPI0013C2B7A6|nr:hypothetical protein [Breoghania sp. L-A4]